MSEQKQQGLLDAVSPKQAFLGGIGAGFLVLCTVGFFILLGMFLSDGGSSAKPSQVVQLPDDGSGAPSEITLTPVDEKNDHIRGNKNAKITIVEFSDFECPFCNRFHDTMQQVMTEYGDDIKWVYRHFPLDSIHPNARPLALASECAAEQGKFWEFADEVFSRFGNGQSVTLGQAEEIARKVGLSNISKFNTCVSENKYADDVQADAIDGQNSGVQGTPFSIIIHEDGQMAPINGAQPFTSVKPIIEQFLTL